MTHNNANVSADPFDDPVTSNKMAIRALIPLLITFVLGTLCLQGFNLVFQQVGADVGAPNQASLITAFPSIVLGIVCFIYGSLGDFVSLRRLVTVGLITLFVGSLFGLSPTSSLPPICGPSSSHECCRPPANRWRAPPSWWSRPNICAMI